MAAGDRRPRPRPVPPGRQRQPRAPAIALVALLGLLAAASILAVRSRLPPTAPRRAQQQRLSYERRVGRHVALTMRRVQTSALGAAAARILERGSLGAAAAAPPGLLSWLVGPPAPAPGAGAAGAFRPMGSLESVLELELPDWAAAPARASSPEAARAAAPWLSASGALQGRRVCERVRRLANGVDTDEAILAPLRRNGTAVVVDALLDEIVRLATTTLLPGDPEEEERAMRRLPALLARQRAREGVLSYVPTGERAWRGMLRTRFLGWGDDAGEGIRFYHANQELDVSTMDESFLGAVVARLWAEHGTEALWLWLTLSEDDASVRVTADELRAAVLRSGAGAARRARLQRRLDALLAERPEWLVQLDPHVLGAWMYHKASDYADTTRGAARGAADGLWLPDALGGALARRTRSSDAVRAELRPLLGDGVDGPGLQLARTMCAVMWSVDLSYASTARTIDSIIAYERGSHVRQAARVASRRAGGRADGLQLLNVGNMEDVLHSYQWSPIASAVYARRLDGREPDAYRASLGARELLATVDRAAALCRLTGGALSLLHCAHGAGHGVYHALAAAAGVETVYYWGTWTLRSMPLAAPTLREMLEAARRLGGGSDDELLLDADGLGELRAFSPLLVLACDRHADALLNATSSAPSGARPPLPLEHFGVHDMLATACLTGVYHSVVAGAAQSGAPSGFGLGEEGAREARAEHTREGFARVAELVDADPGGAPSVQAVILGRLLDPVNLLDPHADLADLGTSWPLLYAFSSLNLCVQQSELHLDALLELQRELRARDAADAGRADDTDAVEALRSVLGPARRAAEACYWSWGRLSENHFFGFGAPGGPEPLVYAPGFAYRLTAAAAERRDAGEVLRDPVRVAEHFLAALRSGERPRLEVVPPAEGLGAVTPGAGEKERGQRIARLMGMGDGDRAEQLLQQPIGVQGRASVLAAVCGVLGDAYCGRRCRGAADGAAAECLQDCLRASRDSARPWCWGGVGAALRRSVGNVVCDGREYLLWKKSSAAGGGAQLPAGPSALMAFHVAVFEMNQCFTLCELHGCSRRDFESCVAGYLVEFAQRTPKMRRLLGFCTALAADDILRGACEAVDGFLEEFGDEHAGAGGEPPARRVRTLSVAGLIIDGLGGFADRWRNLTVPAQMVTCIDAIGGGGGAAGR